MATLERYYVEFENAYQADNKKNESLSKQIFGIYKEYREMFEKTVENLKELGKKRVEARGLELKTDLLQAKGHKQ